MKIRLIEPGPPSLHLWSPLLYPRLGLPIIGAALKRAGFQYVTLDCTGFRSGSLNALLPADVLARRGA